MCINKRYIFDAVFEKQPFGKIYKINLSPEAAIKMLFEKLIQYCYSPIIVKLFEKHLWQGYEVTIARLRCDFY